MAKTNQDKQPVRSKWIEIFSTGRWVSKKGKTTTYTEADLDRMVDTFDPGSFEPPATVGHPEKSGVPAYGWVKDLKREGQKLLAQFDFLPELYDLIKRGIYKNRSVGIAPDGTLDHVAFLGGRSPAVKGLANIEFSEDTESIELFSSTNEENEEMDEKLKRLQEERDALKAKLDEYSGNEKKAMKKKIADLESQITEYSTAAAENEQLKKENAELKRKNEEIERAQRKEKVDAYCQGLVKKGQLTPAQAEKTKKVLHALNGDDKSAEFASGESAESVFKDVLNELPERKELVEEFASKNNASKLKPEIKKAEFGGSEVDEYSVALDARAMEIQKETNCTYMEAVQQARKEV